MASRIYVGSDIKAYGISKNQQYTSVGAASENWPDYAPQNVKEALAKNPGLAHLFVDWPDYMASRKASIQTAAPQQAAPLPGPPIRAPRGFTRSNIR